MDATMFMDVMGIDIPEEQTVTMDMDTLPDNEFDWNDIDEMIDNNVEIPRQRWWEEEITVISSEREEKYISRRNAIFVTRNEQELAAVLADIPEKQLEPDLDFGYPGLLWACDKMTKRFEKWHIQDLEREQERQEQLRIERDQRVAVGLIRPSEPVQPVQKPVVVAVAKVAKPEIKLPVVMFKGTSLRRVESVGEYKSLIKDGYKEKING